MASAEPAGQTGVMRVSTVELFFELVFVFAITQLTVLVEDSHGAFDLFRTLILLVLIWWMYAGYVWLTNATGVTAQMRFVLLIAMAGFLLMGVATPRVFGDGGLVFALAYLFVIVLHLVAFRLQAGPGAARAILGLAPINLGAAGFVIAAAVVHADWNWVLLAAGAAMFVIATLLHRERGFPLNPSHFVDRHAGVMIIALGESVTNIGGGAAGRPFDAPTLSAIVLSLVFIAALWWSYFRRDDERAGRALEAASKDTRTTMAVRAYWYPYIAMLFGIVLVATGVKQVVADGLAPATSAAWLIAGGLAFYLAGSAAFRWLMGIRAVGARGLGAAAVLGLAAAGSSLPSIAWLAVATGLVVALLVVEHELEKGGRETSAA